MDPRNELERMLAPHYAEGHGAPRRLADAMVHAVDYLSHVEPAEFEQQFRAACATLMAIGGISAATPHDIAVRHLLIGAMHGLVAGNAVAELR